MSILFTLIFEFKNNANDWPDITILYDHLKMA